MNKILKNFEFQPNSINEKERSVVVYASTKDVDRYGDIIQPSAFDVEKINSKGLPILFNHNPNSPIGKTLWAKINDLGLMLKVYISDKTQLAKDTWELVKEGIINGASVGFIPIEYKDIEESNGYEFTKVDLIETSLTPVPANPSAVALMLKKVESEEMKELLERSYMKTEIEKIKSELVTKEMVDKYFKENDPQELFKQLDTKFKDLETSVGISNNLIDGFSTKIKEIESIINKHKSWVNERILEIAGIINLSTSKQGLTAEQVKAICSGAIREYVGKLD